MILHKAHGAPDAPQGCTGTLPCACPIMTLDGHVQGAWSIFHLALHLLGGQCPAPVCDPAWPGRAPFEQLDYQR